MSCGADAADLADVRYVTQRTLARRLDKLQRSCPLAVVSSSNSIMVIRLLPEKHFNDWASVY
jgi:hypothetical protein